VRAENARRAEVLTFWRTVEMFSPQDVPAVNPHRVGVQRAAGSTAAVGARSRVGAVAIVAETVLAARHLSGIYSLEAVLPRWHGSSSRTRTASLQWTSSG
jgi:hypothetical protein